MVSNTIASRVQSGMAPPGGNARKIAGGPLYKTGEVLELLTDVEGKPVIAWTRKCVEDAISLRFDQEDLRELLRLAIHAGRFRGTEWCIQRDGGPWAACDAYSVTRQEWIARARKELTIEYFLKFAISRSGKKILLASCHLS